MASHGDLLVIVPGKPNNIVFWSDVDGCREPPCTFLEMVIEAPIVRGSITYQGQLRTAYMSKNWDEPNLLPFNGNATLICGFPFYGPLIINILKVPAI
jgi:hypothetical protein